MNLLDRGTGRSQALGLSVNYSPEFDDAEPNLNLLRRLAELGGGKVLDPAADSPFLHDRQKTFQPQDLRDWLLGFAILLFPFDVGVRRIQLDWEQWLKATATLRRWIFFWKGVPRTQEADDSLAALLNRRGQVRARQPLPESPPSPDLFRPEKQVTSAEGPTTAEGRKPRSGRSPGGGREKARAGSGEHGEPFARCQAPRPTPRPTEIGAAFLETRTTKPQAGGRVMARSTPAGFPQS